MTRLTQERMWLNAHTTYQVPWEARQYAFDIDSGNICVLANYSWDVEVDEKNRVERYEAKDPPQNPRRYPELTYDEVEAIFSEAERTGEPLSVVFYRQYKRKDELTPKQMHSLANCPTVYSLRTAADIAEEHKKETHSVRDFLAASAKKTVPVPSA